MNESRTKSPSLRDLMPTVAHQVERLRDRYGHSHLDSLQSAAARGRPVFHARENGYEFGKGVPELDGWLASIETAFGEDFAYVGLTINLHAGSGDPHGGEPVD